MKLFYKILGLVLSVFLLSSIPVRAEHTPDHRFTVSGYVYDEAGKPAPGPVIIKDVKGDVLGSTEAGRSGYYSIQIHLHDSNVGNTLTVNTEAGKKELIVKFDPKDKTTERKAELNFGMVPPPGPLTGNKIFLYGVAAMVAFGTVYLVTRKRKPRKEERGKKKQKKVREG
jgi:hypothetical protein